MALILILTILRKRGSRDEQSLCKLSTFRDSTMTLPNETNSMYAYMAQKKTESSIEHITYKAISVFEI